MKAIPDPDPFDGFDPPGKPTAYVRDSSGATFTLPVPAAPPTHPDHDSW